MISMVGGIIKLVSRVEDGRFYTIKQVSELVGKTPGWIIQTWKSGKVDGPSHKMILGDGTTGQFVWLYTDDDVERFKDYYARHVRYGRPPWKNKKDSE